MKISIELKELSKNLGRSKTEKMINAQLFCTEKLLKHIKNLSEENLRLSKKGKGSDLFLGKHIAYQSVLIMLNLLQEGEVNEGFISKRFLNDKETN